MSAEELLHLLLAIDDTQYGCIIDWDRIEYTNPKLYHLLKLEKIKLEEGANNG